MGRFVLRRALRATVLVVTAASAALLLVHLAPGDAFTGFDVDPAVAAVERARLGLDRPFLSQYFTWLADLVTFDFGESVRFQRPVATLLRDRAGNTVILGLTALLVAIGAGLPAGVLTASAPDHWVSKLIRAASLVLVSVPPLVTSLVLLMIAARTGWFPVGGFDHPFQGEAPSVLASARFLPLPALALALPIAAALERIQSQALLEALDEPSIAAARARGLSRARVTWVHAWRLALAPVLGVLGIVIGTVLSGSLIVEIVMSWPGLGRLMFDALTGRDLHLAAGAAAAGAMFLAAALMVAELFLYVADPRSSEGR